MKSLIRKLSKDIKTSKDILECIENDKENLKRSRSLEAINCENGSLNKSKDSSPTLTKAPEYKRKLSGLSMRIRKLSDNGNVIKRKISAQPELRSRKTSFPSEMRAQKVSVPPELSMKNISTSSERRIRKGSVQSLMVGRRSSAQADLKIRKMSVPANMKYHSPDKVRVKKVSFINQNTGKSFTMNKTDE